MGQGHHPRGRNSHEMAGRRLDKQARNRDRHNGQEHCAPHACRHQCSDQEKRKKDHHNGGEAQIAKSDIAVNIRDNRPPLRRPTPTCSPIRMDAGKPRTICWRTLLSGRQANRIPPTGVVTARSAIIRR